MANTDAPDPLAFVGAGVDGMTTANPTVRERLARVETILSEVREDVRQMNTDQRARNGIVEKLASALKAHEESHAVHLAFQQGREALRKHDLQVLSAAVVAATAVASIIAKLPIEMLLRAFKG